MPLPQSSNKLPWMLRFLDSFLSLSHISFAPSWQSVRAVTVQLWKSSQYLVRNRTKHKKWVHLEARGVDPLGLAPPAQPSAARLLSPGALSVCCQLRPRPTLSFHGLRGSRPSELGRPGAKSVPSPKAGLFSCCPAGTRQPGARAQPPRGVGTSARADRLLAVLGESWGNSAKPASCRPFNTS